MPFTICINRPGTLPEMDPYEVSTLTEALEACATEIEHAWPEETTDETERAWRDVQREIEEDRNDPGSLDERAGLLYRLPDGYVIDVTYSPSLAETAGAAYECFETAQRDDDPEQTYTRLHDGAPEWVKGIVYAAHNDGELLPDDYRYQWTQEALGAILDAGEDAELDDLEHEFADDVDVYASNRLAWLSSHVRRPGYVDEAVAEGLISEDPDEIDRIGVGQYMERREVFGLVLGALRTHLEAEPGEER